MGHKEGANAGLFPKTSIPSKFSLCSKAVVLFFERVDLCEGSDGHSVLEHGLVPVMLVSVVVTRKFGS